jgi:hypothetical protein
VADRAGRHEGWRRRRPREQCARSILGNYVHDIAGGTENHGVYIDGGDGIEVGWNTIQRVVSGNLFQTYDAWSSTGITNLSVHDNLLEHGGRYGLNLSEQTVSGTFARNVINDTALAGLRISVNNDHTIALTLTDNSGTGFGTRKVRTAPTAPSTATGTLRRAPL